MVKLKDENGGYLVVYHSEDGQSVNVSDHGAMGEFKTKEIPYDNLIAMMADSKIYQFSAESRQAYEKQIKQEKAERRNAAWDRLLEQKINWAVQQAISTKEGKAIESLDLGGISAWRTGGKTVISQQSIIEKVRQSNQTPPDTTTLTASASLAMLLADNNSYVNADELTNTTTLYDNEKPNEDNMQPFFASMQQNTLTPEMADWEPLKIISAYIPSGSAEKQMSALQKKIEANGPAIVNVITKSNVTDALLSGIADTRISQSFFVVVDAISNGLVTVRNPTSGAIEEISEAEFMKSIDWYSKVVQLQLQ